MRLPTLFLAAAAALWSQCAGTEPVAATIPALQGRELRSPCVNRVVVTTGVVTVSSRGLGGFFLQDPAGDGDPATSDGVFIFQGTTAAEFPAPGNVVRVTGRVVEFSRSGYTGTVTEIDIRSSATPLARVEAIGVAPLPSPVDLDAPLNDAAAYLEAREGMLAYYPEAAVVMPSNRFGEYYALRYDRVPDWVRPFDDRTGSGKPLLIDTTGGAYRKEPATFDLVPELNGALHFDFGVYRLEPGADYDIGNAGFAPVPAPPITDGLRIATLNTERLVRSLTADALELKLSKLARAIRDLLQQPHLIAVQEVSDLALLEQLGARAGGYEAVLLPGCDFGGINVGLLYRTPVTLTRAYQWQAEAPEFRNGRCTLPDGRAFTQFLFDRPPLVAELEAGGSPFAVVVNHWRSQIGDTAGERMAGAEFVASEVQRLALPVVVLGDLNDTEHSAPVRTLENRAELQLLTRHVPPESRYSLLFEGRSQAFDHILVSAGSRLRWLRTGYAHGNADFPVAPFAVPDSPVRAADHDMPWADFFLPPPR